MLLARQVLFNLPAPLFFRCSSSLSYNEPLPIEPILLSPEMGTRAGLHSQTLISTGLADLDRILGGGLPLGSVLLLLGDAFTPHCSTLLRYFVAEGVACRHRVYWASATTPDPASLPQLAKPRSPAEVLPAPCRQVCQRRMPYAPAFSNHQSRHGALPVCRMISRRRSTRQTPSCA